MSFGREGQGPGEFLAHPMRAHLKISFGNDGKLYVNDPGNSRLSIFSKEGRFIKSFKLPPYTYDTPIVNSKGDIYLLSKSGIKVIDCYDSNFKYKASLLDMEEHLQFPFGKPFSSHNYLRNPNEFEVLKGITKKDHLIILSNYSLKAFVFDKEGRKVNEFEIKESEFIKDFEKRLEQVREENKRNKGRIKEFEPSNLLLPFQIFVVNDNLYVVYTRSDNKELIYQYNIEGKLLKKSYIREGRHFRFPLCSNDMGLIYFSLEQKTKIEILKYFNKGGLRDEKRIKSIGNFGCGDFDFFSDSCKPYLCLLAML